MAEKEVKKLNTGGKFIKSQAILSIFELFKKPFIHIILIIILGLLVYSNTFNVPFHFDDTPNIVENYKLRDLSNFWPPSGSRWVGFLTFALNYHFGGLDTIGYHIVNLSIHILNAILVYWLVVLTFRTPYFSASNPPSPPFSKGGMVMTRRGGFALFSALIFVSHPIQTQAVTYLVQRFTSLAALFYLLSIVLYIKWRLITAQQRNRAAEQQVEKKSYCATALLLYCSSLLSAILAMKTKEIAFTLPLIITLYEFMFFNGKIKKRVLYLIPLILTMLIIPLSFIDIDKPIGDTIGELRETAQETEEIPRWSYLLTQFRVIVTYIRLLFLPINQNLDYDYPIYHSFFEPNVFLSFLFLLAILALVIYLFYTTRYKLHTTRLIAFGTFWFFITLSVESSIIPIRDVIFEHRVYLPSVGIIIAFSIAIFYFPLRFTSHVSRFSFPAVYLLLSTIIITFSIATYQRNIVWSDKITLWEDTVNKSYQKYRSHYNLGLAYQNSGINNKAIEHYLAVIRLKPDHVGAYVNLGMIYASRGLFDLAIEKYRTALKIDPNCIEAHNNIGNAYDTKGLTDDAIVHYQRAISLNPTYVEAHYNIAIAYENKGLIGEAVEHYRMSLRINPDYSAAQIKLNTIYLRHPR